MKTKLSSRLARSLAGIAASSPAETLRADSRYLVLSDLRMGDGGRKDELLRAKRATIDLLGGWYLPRGYTLVLAGDVEDLRRFWLKSIAAAWADLYAVFDAFDKARRLRKIVGDRDLALTLLRSYPYGLSHGLRLEGRGGSILVLHGHQASRPYVGRDYLKEYLAYWQYSGVRRKDEAEADTRGRRENERRLYRASRRLGIVSIAGHARRPLFGSEPVRDSIPPREGRRAAVPRLFSPGRFLEGGREGGSRELRMLEIEGDRLSQVTWSPGSGESETRIGRRSYLRREPRTASLEELFAGSGRPAAETAAAEGGSGR